MYQYVPKYWTILECVDPILDPPVMSTFAVEFSSAMPSLPSGLCAPGQWYIGLV